MPIECNKISRDCPQCHTNMVYDTGKSYFCSKCLATIPKSESDIKVEPMVEQVVEPEIENDDIATISDFSIEEKPVIV